MLKMHAIIFSIHFLNAYTVNAQKSTINRDTINAPST